MHRSCRQLLEYLGSLVGRFQRDFTSRKRQWTMPIRRFLLAPPSRVLDRHNLRKRETSNHVHQIVDYRLKGDSQFFNAGSNPSDVPKLVYKKNSNNCQHKRCELNAYGLCYVKTEQRLYYLSTSVRFNTHKNIQVGLMCNSVC